MPGPGQYDEGPKLGEKSVKVTIKGRTINPLSLTSQKFNPGPGTYEPKTSINKNGSYIVSTFKNSLTPTMSLP